MSYKIKYSYGKQHISWSDIWEVVKTLRSPFLTQGPKVEEFERALCDYTGAKYAVAVSSGAAALHLSVLALGIGKGDEVITTPMTFVATANCILYAGGIVKFADIDEKTACIDPVNIEKAISNKTKAIIPVHFAGQSCDMERIYKIAQDNSLFIIEDAAHAIGSYYKYTKVGSCKYSNMTIFSFHPVKTITTAEGGAITTNDQVLYEKLLRLRSHGITRKEAYLINNDGPWYYEMLDLGFNYRLTDIQAALGISQLKRLDKFIKRRREIVEIYKQAFLGDNRFNFLVEKEYSKAAYHLFPLLINFDEVRLTKKEIFAKLEQKGLKLQVHYIPVHLQPYYRNLGFNLGDFSNSEDYYKKTISLPLYSSLSNRDVAKIVSMIREI